MIHLKEIKYICGTNKINTSPLQAFDDDVCNFLSELSEILIRSKETKQYPDVYSLAFWCRHSKIQKLKENFGSNEFQIGRGLCFHITPSNIPINFAFSYFFSLLAGNSNIVRLPSKEYPQINYLFALIEKILSKYPKIFSRTSFIQYSKDNEATTEFSKIADIRMIWGGDNTIRQLKNIPTPPRCIDITFPDRYSICIIDGDKIISSNENQINKLVNDFYNDTYLMDQNACSSPQLIYWINHSDEAKDKFWSCLYNFAKQKYQLQDAIAISKYTQSCIDAINLKNINKITNMDNLLYRIELNSLDANLEKLRGKGGYFYEFNLNNYEELFKIITSKYQTVTYYGIDSKEFKKNIMTHNLRGIDRVVPIGKAMEIDVFWDGYDLIKTLSRSIT